MANFTFNRAFPKNLALLFKERAHEIPDDVFQYSKMERDGDFLPYTYGQVYDEVISLALALQKMGIKRGQNVGLISDNRREWAVTDYAILSLGATDVPRGCDSMGTEIRFILNFADVEISFFETPHQLEKVLENTDECPNLKTAIIYKKPSKSEDEIINNKKIKVILYKDLLKEGKEIFETDKEKFRAQIEAEMDKTETDDIATIIFTSGTTGTPKGVMLSHRNYIAQLEVFHNFFPCKRGETWLSVLPVWHSYERAFQYLVPALKTNIAYSKPVAQVMITDMEKIKPHWLCAVPRLWDAIAKNIDRTVHKHKGFDLFCYNTFIKPGIVYAHFRDMIRGWIVQDKKRNRFADFLIGIFPFLFLWPIHALGDICFFNRVRKGLGGRIRIAVSGGGALQREVNDFFRSVGFNLLEAYGLTETAPVLSVRHYKNPRPGCVGAIMPSCEVKIVREENGMIADSAPLAPGQKGLVLARGEQIMKGYYKRPDLTEKIIDSEGWLNTGDLGLLTFDGELKLTGRAKDTIVLLGGENIEPAVIERAINASDYIDSSIVMGQDKNYLGCLIVATKDKIEDYAKQNKIEYSSYAELLQKEEINAFYSKIIHSLVSVSTGFRSCERINKFVLLSDPFKTGEELSAKGEMIRAKIVKKYEKEVESMFD